MSHFEMALELIAALECPCAAINGARKFAVNGSVDSNSTCDSTNLTSGSMHQSAMSITLMRSGKKNVAFKAFEVSHEYQMTIYRRL
jgi:hypothetical protein